MQPALRNIPLGRWQQSVWIMALVLTSKGLYSLCICNRDHVVLQLAFMYMVECLGPLEKCYKKISSKKWERCWSRRVIILETMLEKLHVGFVPAYPPSEHSTPHVAMLPAHLSTESALGASFRSNSLLSGILAPAKLSRSALSLLALIPAISVNWTDL